MKLQRGLLPRCRSTRIERRTQCWASLTAEAFTSREVLWEWDYGLRDALHPFALAGCTLPTICRGADTLIS
ncbi:MAG UNVERIFIED_CONTAM: hypothetical protein LVT10_17985 [Anaerolineae bacterium]